MSVTIRRTRYEYTMESTSIEYALAEHIGLTLLGISIYIFAR